MGYCYKGGALVCDACGTTTGVRKRTCPERVGPLPYCIPAALCRECYGGERATLHAGCVEGARKARERDAAEAAIVAGGGFLVRSAWGDWHPLVPAGEVGVLFHGANEEQRWALVSAHAYDRRGPLAALADFEARPWPEGRDGS